MSIKKPQTWQIVNEEPLDVIETSSREPIHNLNKIINSKAEFPFRITLTGSVINIMGSEVQALKSDGAASTINSYKTVTAPINNTYITFNDSTLNVISGAITGSLQAVPISPTMIASEYVWMGLEARSDGFIYLLWGTPAAIAGNATFPIFITGTAIALILLQDNGTGGQWHFNNPVQSNIKMFKGSGGGGGGGLNLTIKDEGSSISTAVTEINVVGPAITATETSAGKVTITSIALAYQLIGETPSGAIDDGNVAYILAYTPIFSDSVIVTLGGLIRKITTDFSISGTTLTFVNAPAAGSSLFVIYGTTNKILQNNLGIGDGTTSSFSAKKAIDFLVNVDGLVSEPGVEYSVSGSLVSFLNGYIPAYGQRILSYTYGTGQITQETLSGTVDESNKDFTFSSAPTASGSVIICINGIIQEKNVDYTISGVIVSFTTAPVVGQVPYGIKFNG